MEDLEAQLAAANARGEVVLQRNLNALKVAMNSGIGAINVTPAQRKESAEAKRELNAAMREIKRLEKDLRAQKRESKKKPAA